MIDNLFPCDIGLLVTGQQVTVAPILPRTLGNAYGLRGGKTMEQSKQEAKFIAKLRHIVYRATDMEAMAQMNRRRLPILILDNIQGI